MKHSQDGSISNPKIRSPANVHADLFIHIAKCCTPILCSVAKAALFVYYMFYCHLMFRQLRVVGKCTPLRTKYFRRKTNKQQTRWSSLGMGMSNTRGEFQGLLVESGVDIWTFVVKNVLDTSFPSNDVVLVCDVQFFVGFCQ